MLSSTADLAQARLPSSPASSRSTMPQRCIAAQGATKHTDLDIFAPQICALRCAKPSSQPCLELSPSVMPKRQESLRACSCTTGFQRAKAGGGDMCYSSHGLLPTRQRVLRAGDVAQLMRCRQSLLALQPGPPCPVARVPFWSSCARVRKRDEIMSVPISTQTLHESRSGRLAGH